MPTFSIQIVPILSIFVVRQEDDAMLNATLYL